jgi:hypothetical protein
VLLEELLSLVFEEVHRQVDRMLGPLAGGRAPYRND